MIAIRNKAESILNNLAKHLVALKASEGRLNRAARRSYLQVRLYDAIAITGLRDLTSHLGYLTFFFAFRIFETNSLKMMTIILFE